ncbi:MAG: surface antigen [Acidimicrobiia bacterium]|nr:surface antigen [Acidimicrobiia bacterium]
MSKTRLKLGAMLATALFGLLSCSGASTAKTAASSTANSAAAPASPLVSASPSSSSQTSVSQGVPALSPSLTQVPHRVYVPNGLANRVTVIDPVTRRVISTFPTALEPQHVVPSYDLQRLWVLDDGGNNVIPIDPNTSKPLPAVKVDDPYNMYFTPDGRSAIVVAERHRELDFRDAHTMALQARLPVPGCDGVNHIDYSGDYRYLIATCEFNGKLIKIDWAAHRVLGTLQLPQGSMVEMPQDIRVGSDGRTFFVAEMTAGGLAVIDGDSFRVTGFIPTGVGTHGITPSRDGTKLYVTNRGSTGMTVRRHGEGSLSVVDVATQKVVGHWDIPGGGSPDMGNLSTDGTELWVSGRFDSEVYVFDVVRGVLAARIPVAAGPHGLTYWPQPGRFSLGHTGNMRS